DRIAQLLRLGPADLEVADLEHDVREPLVALRLAQRGQGSHEGALLHAEQLGEERRIGRRHVVALEPHDERAALRHARPLEALHQPADGEQDGDREQRPAQRPHVSSLDVRGPPRRWAAMAAIGADRSSGRNRSRKATRYPAAVARDVYIAAVGLTKVDLTGNIFASVFDLFAEAYQRAIEESPVRSFEALQIGIMDSEEFENRANLAAKVADRLGLTGIPAVRSETASS